MQINGREIGPDQPPYLIAEISGNHCGYLREALYLIGAAKQYGADAVKLQCYQAGSLTLNSNKPDFIVKDGPWKGRKLYELYRQCETPRDWFPELFARAREIGITLFSSVFSQDDVDFLEGLDCPAYKIASMEIADTNLIRRAARTGKPVIISTGMASDDEIDNALAAGGGGDQVLLLHCVSGYPTDIAESNLWRLRWMNGISDHSLGWEVPVAATAMGAHFIEKHLTSDRNNGSEDAPFSLELAEFQQMAKAVRNIWQAMQYVEPKSEQPSRQLRRSLYVVKNVKEGEELTEDSVRSIRPSYGLPPMALQHVIGSHAARDLEEGTALTEDMVDPW